MLKISIEVGQNRYLANMGQSYSIAIPVQFNGEQPNHFGVPGATAQAIEGGGFVGDTRRGGSCNVDSITLIPHCNGTHTECVGHIVDERQSVHQHLKDSLVLAHLVSICPTVVSGHEDQISTSWRKALNYHDYKLIIE